MSNRDNLRQAAKEFFGGDANRSDRDAEIFLAETATANALARARAEAGPSAAEIAGGSSPGVSEMVVLEPRKQTSVIAEGTSIIGRVRSTGHVEVMGKVDGSIDADGDVTVCGKVAGNVKGDQLRMLSCQVKGNLEADSRVMINSESVIIGDVRSDTMVIDGKLKGNINVSKTAIFNSNSYLLGDITTSTISVDAGAIINGMVRTVVDYDAESPFDKL